MRLQLQMVLVWLEYPPQFPSQAKRPQWFVGESNKPEKKTCLAGWPAGERETKPWAMKNCNPTIQSGGPFLPGTYRFWLVGNNLPNPNRMALLCCADKDKGREQKRRGFCPGWWTQKQLSPLRWSHPSQRVNKGGSPAGCSSAAC